MYRLQAQFQGRTTELHKNVRAVLTLVGCGAGLALAAPAAMAQATDDLQHAVDSPIHAEDGTVLAETVRPEESAAGEQTCKAPDLFNPLLTFKDRRDYFVAPAGDFEDPNLPGWQLTGGAQVSQGGSVHAVIGGAQANSLSLPPGSSATSPEMCVDLNYPVFRFFAAQLNPDTDSELVVDVILSYLRKQEKSNRAT